MASQEGKEMNEQILARLQTILKLESAIIEQLETLSWELKDLLEDIVLDMSKDSSALPDGKGAGKPEVPHPMESGGEGAKGCPGP